MLGRRSKAAEIAKPVAAGAGVAVGRAAETVTELAEKAIVAAREAQRVAAPALRSAAHTSADTLSHAAEKAAEVLAEAAERLAEEVPAVAAPAAAVQAAVGRPRPKRWRRRVRRLLIVTGVAGAAYVAVTKTPLKSKLSELVFGPPLDEEEPEPITLPVTGTSGEGATNSQPEAPEEHEAEPAEKSKGRGATSSSAPPDDGASA
ncbi:MAG TPA: hypothetical protein VEK76_14030 [Candidatus Binatia bacterium]|nr:hypothetical protein [Candidatus Binatia bacterium]